MKIAIFQMISRSGDLYNNAQKIINAALQAQQEGAEILITPELSLSGMVDMQQLNHPFFWKELETLRQQIIQSISNITLIIGYPTISSPTFSSVNTLQNSEYENIKKHNTVSAFKNGELLAYFNKNKLNKFDIDAGITPIENNSNNIFVIDDFYFSLHCEEECLFNNDLIKKKSMLINCKNTFFDGKTIIESAKRTQPIPQISTGMVGFYNEYVLIGNSHSISNKNHNIQAEFCEESLSIVDFNEKGITSKSINKTYSREELIYRAAQFAIKEYCAQNKFNRICLGLSGGIDSALVLALAVDAMGAENCEVLLMPSQYTAPLSNTSAEKMAKNLKVKYETIAISPIFEAFKHSLSHRFEGLESDVTEENLQARIRGTLLMALSNKTGALLLSTGNKSESAMGYATLYGDMNGGFAPIKDILKTDVYALSNWRNQHAGYDLIAQEIIDRAPSAELRENQTDQDSLPDYAILDAMLLHILEDNYNMDQLLKDGYDLANINRVISLLHHSVYKRKQGAPGVRLSTSALGLDIKESLCNLWLEKDCKK